MGLSDLVSARGKYIVDVRAYNRAAWDKRVAESDPWTVPVSAEAVERARHGDFAIVLTPTRPVPTNWFPPLRGMPTLCLASGGGQQGPLLAAAGADVTVVDNSPRQLAQDQFVAKRDGLPINIVEGDMADLSKFENQSFGLIVHPCSNCYVPQIRIVWKECFRVLRPGGVLLAGFCNPVRWIFEDSRHNNGVLTVRYSIPHSDVEDLSEADRQQRIIDKQVALEFSHTLEDQIDGQLCVGFVLTGFYEDRYLGPDSDPISSYLPTFIATRAVKQ